MKRVLLIMLLALLPLMALQALRVESVRATDNGKRSSRVTLSLSESAEASIQSSGDLIRVNISGATLGTTSADYRRLSHIIDYISLQENPTGVSINIKIMGNFRVSHSQSGRRVYIDIVNPEVPEPSPPSRPISPSVAQTASPTVSPQPQPLSQEPAVSEAEDISSIEAADSSKVRVRSKLGIPQIPDYKITKASFLVRLTEAIMVNLKIYLIILVICLILLVWLFYLEIKCRKGSNNKPDSMPKVPKPEPKNESLDLGLGGSTLIMDTDTKIRMVTKLLEEGWNTRQIAKEMKISPKEIEKIAKKAQMSD